MNSQNYIKKKGIGRQVDSMCQIMMSHRRIAILRRVSRMTRDHDVGAT